MQTIPWYQVLVPGICTYTYIALAVHIHYIVWHCTTVCDETKSIWIRIWRCISNLFALQFKARIQMSLITSQSGSSQGSWTRWQSEEAWTWSFSIAALMLGHTNQLPPTSQSWSIYLNTAILETPLNWRKYWARGIVLFVAGAVE